MMTGIITGRALRIVVAIAVMLGLGLSLAACGRRGTLDTPKANYPQTKADPATKMQKTPARHLWLDNLLQ